MSICTQAQALSAYTPQQVSSDEIGIGEDERRCLNEAAACNTIHKFLVGAPPQGQRVLVEDFNLYYPL